MPSAPRYRRHPSVQLRPDGNGAVALHLGSGQYFELNPSARFIWEQLEASPTLDALVAEVTARFDVPPPEARDLVAELLQTLQDEGLVQREGAAPGGLRATARASLGRLWRRLRR